MRENNVNIIHIALYVFRSLTHHITQCIKKVIYACNVLYFSSDLHAFQWAIYIVFFLNSKDFFYGHFCMIVVAPFVSHDILQSLLSGVWFKACEIRLQQMVAISGSCRMVSWISAAHHNGPLIDPLGHPIRCFLSHKFDYTLGYMHIDPRSIGSTGTFPFYNCLKNLLLIDVTRNISENKSRKYGCSSQRES